MSKTIGSSVFRQDPRWAHADDARPDLKACEIDGVIIEPLVRHSDDRGNLVELLTSRTGPVENFVHSYIVTAAPGSVRAWVYHKLQHDRLHFTTGLFKIVLYDIREDSPSFGTLSVLEAGLNNPIRLVLPPFVVHGVCNIGESEAYFINMPTQLYDLKNPDKYRIQHPSPDIPFEF